MTRFSQKGVLDSVDFKIFNLNHKYEWKQVRFIFRFYLFFEINFLSKDWFLV